MPSFAFFDLDHTLLPYDTQAMFCNFVLRRQRWRTVYHLTFLPFAVLKALRLLDTLTAKRAFMNYLAGLPRETLLALAKEFAEQVVKPRLYPELLAEIGEHRRAGRILVLNTASPDFYADEITRVLGFDHGIATRVVIPERVPLLPHVVGENNKHEVKIARMQSAIPALAQSDAATLRDSWSYSDSSADLPLLEFAGNAVLVHPNARLEAIGRSRGWKILRPARPYQTKAGDMLCVARQVLGLAG